jgi:hypothetical protein
VWTPATTFKDCLELGVAEFTDKLVSIADSASKEYSVEQTLEKMMGEWENCMMELTPYKDTGTFIMKIPEETQQMLDDHLVLTQQISFSPFKGPFEERIDEWEENLKITSDVIDEWMDVQKYTRLFKFHSPLALVFQAVDVSGTDSHQRRYQNSASCREQEVWFDGANVASDYERRA